MPPPIGGGGIITVHLIGCTWISETQTFESLDSDCSFGVQIAGNALSLGIQHNTERSFAEYATQH